MKNISAVIPSFMGERNILVKYNNGDFENTAFILQENKILVVIKDSENNVSINFYDDLLQFNRHIQFSCLIDASVKLKVAAFTEEKTAIREGRLIINKDSVDNVGNREIMGVYHYKPFFISIIGSHYKIEWNTLNPTELIEIFKLIDVKLLNLTQCAA